MAFRFLFSIRKKITLGFYLLLSVMTGTVGLTYAIVQQIEKKVVFVEVIDDFFNITLELRRFEKNYFLYGQDKDFHENKLYWQRLHELFHSRNDAFKSLVTSEDYEDTGKKVDEYKTAMQQLRAYNTFPAVLEDARERGKLEEKIRATGKSLTDFAEQTSLSERTSIKNLLQTTRSILVLSILAMLCLAIVIATMLGRSVVKSLKILEEYTTLISKGELREASTKAGEHEINTLLSAFNRMVFELKTRQQQLFQSEKLAALGTLLSGVAHELNNPLSNISTSAQILAEEIEVDNIAFKKSLIGQIEEQSDKARDIVRSLLEFSRIKEFKKQMLSLKQLINETVLLIRGQVPSQIGIAIDVPDNLEIMVDKQRIQQVFLNLIKNGIDAIGETGHIWVSARETGEPGNPHEVEILIEDDGPGIAPEHLQRIFDPFFTTKDVGEGTGLGLAVSYSLVNQMNGSIEVSSQAGQGTLFTISLPATQDCIIHSSRENTNHTEP